MNVGAINDRPKEVLLSKYGIIVDDAIKSIGKHYPAVSVDNYVIIPNHVHLLLQIHSDSDGLLPPPAALGSLPLALQNGIDVKTVSSMLGHSNAGFTLATYTHATNKVQEQAAAKMGKLLGKAI